jgi:flagellar FliJ protein
MAARFVFSLQPVLDERRRKEDETRHAFARAGQARNDDIREADRLGGALRARGRALHECAIAGSVASLRVHDAHLRYLERTMQSHERRSSQSATAFERAAADLLQANRERRLIEKLKERRRQEFEREEARLEELELDDANARLRSWRK